MTDNRMGLYRNQPLEFSFSSKGLAVTGGTNSAPQLRAFLAKLEGLVALLPDDDSGDHIQEGHTNGQG